MDIDSTVEPELYSTTVFVLSGLTVEESMFRADFVNV